MNRSFKHSKHFRQLVTVFVGGIGLGVALVKIDEELNPRKPLEQISFRPQPNESPTNTFPISSITRTSGNLSVNFSLQTRNPNWVYEILTKEDLNKSLKNPRLPFKEPKDIPKHLRSSLKDFKNSGYDRGHLAAAANHHDESLEESYVLTNVSPQVTGLNRGHWAQLEAWARKLVTTGPLNEIHVITGPIFLPECNNDGLCTMNYPVLGAPPGIAVPTHFFKVFLIYTSVGVAASAFVLPNRLMPSDVPLASFRMPLKTVEQWSGVWITSELGGKEPLDLCDIVDCSSLMGKVKSAKYRGHDKS